jgi:hypothetical protein
MVEIGNSMTLGSLNEVPPVETTCEARILGVAAFKVFGDDFRFEPLSGKDCEARSIRCPADYVTILFIIQDIKQLIKMKKS